MMETVNPGSDPTEASKRNPLEFHKLITVADCHCDTLLEIANKGRRLFNYSEEGHVDLPRLRQGGVNLQFFAAFIETVYKPFNALTRSLELINIFYREIEMCGGLLAVGTNARQIKKLLKDDKIVAILGIEGGEALNGNLAVLHILYRLGVRFLGLTWNQRNQIADGVGEGHTGGGLTKFGREVVREMNSLGMLIDLAHISEAGFWDVLTHSNDPLMVSHANCYKLLNHPRNLKDDQIIALAKSGGVMGLSFFPEFTGNNIDDFLDHIDFVAGLAGTEVIALGSDFDGIEKTPDGLEDARSYPQITSKLIERGYTEKEIRGIMGGNVLRLIGNVLV
ncbi:MAG: dipeptidase [Thermincola sp.]|jgi:membrane dipeptidase|nr:dipeptidase [Thermincola sp.]MDT3701641.1 dipeptidase [Thermincola sp.]